MKKITLLFTLFAFVFVFANSSNVVTVKWSIVDGSVLESFKGVTATFSGVDSVGRKLDGVEVTEVRAQNSATNVLFYEVGENDELIPVETGTLFSQTDKLSVTYIPTKDKGYKNLVDGAYVKQGNYCIVIDEGDLLFNPKREGKEKVYNDQKYVLNFSIKNNYSAQEFIEADYTVSPKNNSTLDEIRKIEIIFPEYESIAVKDTTLNGLDWLPCEYSVETEEQGSMWETKAPMQWSAVEGKPNALRIFVSSEMFGSESVVDADYYQITIPEGIVCFSETSTSTICNQTIVLNYKVSGKLSDVVNVIAADVYVCDGMIVADGEMRIFTITGQDVTCMNGSLERGIYVVKYNNSAVKVIVK